MLLFWPWAQQSPLVDPLRALAYFLAPGLSLPHPLRRPLYPGDRPALGISAGPYCAGAAGALLLLLAAAPVAALGLRWRAGWRARARRRRSRSSCSASPSLFPVAYAIAIKAVLFDGMRHFIFVLPPIAALAALVADRALDRLWRVRPQRRLPMALLVALRRLGHVGVMARLHPDEYVYYNGFIGGVKARAGLFKLDYWANSYAEAVHGLEDYLRAEYGRRVHGPRFHRRVCGPPGSAAYYFPSNFIYHQRPRGGASSSSPSPRTIATRRCRARRSIRVERMGTLLSLVIDRREILAPGRAPPAVLGASP